MGRIPYSYSWLVPCLAVVGAVALSCAPKSTWNGRYPTPPSVLVDTIPPDVTQAFREALVEWAGEAFVADHVSLASCSTRYPRDVRRRRFAAVWTIKGSDDLPTMGITTIMNASGKIFVPRRELPDWIVDPDSHKLTVSREDAVEIARRAGMEKGLRPWEVQFTPTQKRLKWTVTSVLEIVSQKPGMMEYWARVIEIDASTGEIFGNRRSLWTRQ